MQNQTLNKGAIGVAKEQCEYGGDCSHCLYVKTCTHPAREMTAGVYINEKVMVKVSKEAVSRALKKRGLSYYRAAEEMGLKGHKLYSRIKMGVRIDIETVRGLARLTDTTVDDLRDKAQPPEVRIVRFYRIDERIKADKTTAREVSRRAGMSPGYLTAMKHGRVVPSVDFLKKVCNVLALKESEVFEVHKIT